MIDPTQIRQRSEQRYPAFLTSLLTGESFFPIEFPVGLIPKNYLALRDAVIQLIGKSKQHLGYGYTVELESRRTQKHGSQSLPKRITIETEQDYLKLIKKEKEVLQFKSDIELIRTNVPGLNQWLFRNPLKVTEYGDR